MNEFRTEKDSLGEVQVPASAWYGAQTVRAIANFAISGRGPDKDFVEAHIRIKLAAARANCQPAWLSMDKRDAIVAACEKILVEGDGVPSAIRIIDIVFVEDSMPQENRAPFLLFLLVRGRFQPGETRAGILRIDLVNTLGEKTLLQEKNVVAHDKLKYPTAPVGFNVVAQVRLIPKRLGTCFIVASFEDERAQVAISFIDQQPDPDPI